jgi:hypothetical protein
MFSLACGICYRPCGEMPWGGGYEYSRIQYSSQQNPGISLFIPPLINRRQSELFDLISSILPGHHATMKNLGISISFFQEMLCPTGRRFFPGSGSIEDNFLVF